MIDLVQIEEIKDNHYNSNAAALQEDYESSDGMEFEDTINRRETGLEDSGDQYEMENSYSSTGDVVAVSSDDQCELASRSNNSQPDPVRKSSQRIPRQDRKKRRIHPPGEDSDRM